MFRNQIRKGIRAVKAGSDPVGLFREDGGGDPDLLQRHGRARAAGKNARSWTRSCCARPGGGWRKATSRRRR